MVAETGKQNKNSGGRLEDRKGRVNEEVLRALET